MRCVLVALAPAAALAQTSFPMVTPVTPMAVQRGTAAECDRVPICVQGFVPINFVVKIGYASEPIWLTIKK